LDWAPLAVIQRRVMRKNLDVNLTQTQRPRAPVRDALGLEEINRLKLT
jgi:hypothetical protein